MVNRKANLNQARTLQINNKLTQNLIGKQVNPFSEIQPFTSPLYEPPRSIYGNNPDINIPPNYWTKSVDCPFYYVNGKVALGKSVPECTLDICGDVKIDGQFF